MQTVIDSIATARHEDLISASIVVAAGIWVLWGIVLAALRLARHKFWGE